MALPPRGWLGHGSLAASRFLQRCLSDTNSRILTLERLGSPHHTGVYVRIPIQVKDTSLVEEVMLAALCVIVAMVACWAFYEGLVTGEVPKKFGHATSTDNPIAYWVIMGGYVIVILPACLLGIRFATGRLIRRSRRFE